MRFKQTLMAILRACLRSFALAPQIPQFWGTLKEFYFLVPLELGASVYTVGYSRREGKAQRVSESNS